MSKIKTIVMVMLGVVAVLSATTLPRTPHEHQLPTEMLDVESIFAE